MARYLICKVTSPKVRGIICNYSAASGWKPYYGPDNVNDRIEQPAYAPYFFLDLRDKDYGFAREDSEVHVEGREEALEQMLTRAFEGPEEAWTNVEVSLGCGHATIYRDGSITVKGAATIDKIKRLVEIHAEYFGTEKHKQ